jgi:hypothetical protein
LSARWDIPYCLEEMAYVAHGMGRSGDAALLYGAAQVQRDLLGAPLSVLEQKMHEQHVEEIRRALGDVEFRKHWDEGRLLDTGEAFERAFERHMSHS